IERTLALGGGEKSRARRVAELLASDPILPDDLEPPRFPAAFSSAQVAKASREYLEIDNLARAGDYREAWHRLVDWAAQLGEQTGGDLRLWTGALAWHATVLDWQQSKYEDAIADATSGLLELEDEPEYLVHRPEALYVLGRVHYSRGEYQKGVAM